MFGRAVTRQRLACPASSSKTPASLRLIVRGLFCNGCQADHVLCASLCAYGPISHNERLHATCAPFPHRQWADAYETSVRGLEWSVRRRASGCETLTHFALALRLCAARCLRRLGRLDEAEYAFKVLAGARGSLGRIPPWTCEVKADLEHSSIIGPG